MNSNKFSDLPLIEPIQKALIETGYTTPTPIQTEAIPHLLQKKDLLGVAQTGTGKTAAFALPILNNLMTSPQRLEPRRPRVLVLTPTRELSVQIFESFQTYGKNLRLKYAVVFGGVGQGPQVKSLSQGVDVLIATPGRLLDLIDQRFINLNKLEVFVLDEADRMLDMGFVHTIREIIAMLPPKRHNLFFSATMPPDIVKLSSTMLTDPIRVEVTPPSSTVDMIQQSVMYVEKNRKTDLLRHVLKDKALKRVIVFTRTKHGADRVVKVLDRNQISAAAIHGNKSQNARQHALEQFRRGNVRVLIATDIAARGIDIDGITHVINYDVPNISESYVHRIGRTARAGAQGSAISFSDSEERSFLRDIEKLIGKQIPVDIEHPYHSLNVAQAKMLSKGKAKAMLEMQENRGGANGKTGNRGYHKWRNRQGQRQKQNGGGGGKSFPKPNPSW